MSKHPAPSPLPIPPGHPSKLFITMSDEDEVSSLCESPWMMSPEGFPDHESRLVCDPNADLAVYSGEGMLFRVFSKDLETYADGFPEKSVLSQGAVYLLESSQVLELLFQFTRRQRQPAIAHVKFEVFAEFAEAVEKYEVFPAIEVCKARMRRV